MADAFAALLGDLSAEFASLLTVMKNFAGNLDDRLRLAKKTRPDVAAVAYTPPAPQSRPAFTTPKSSVSPKPPAVPKRSAENDGSGAIAGNEQRLLDSLATWRAIGHEAPSNPQVAWLASYSPTSTSYTNPRGALRTKGLLEYLGGDRLRLTEAGAALANPAPVEGPLLDHVLAKLPGNEARVLAAAAAFFPNAASNEDVAACANYSPTSTSYTNPRGALRTKALLSYEGAGVRVVDWLFEKAA